MLLSFAFLGAAVARYRRLGSMYNRNLRHELNLVGRAPRVRGPQWAWDATGIRFAW